MTDRLDLRVPKGTRIVQPVQVLTDGVVVALPNGTTAKMQIRATKQSDIVLAELSTVNGRLVLDLNNAKVTIIMATAFTTAFTFERGVYDLNITYPDTEAERIVEGSVYVMPSATR